MAASNGNGSEAVPMEIDNDTLESVGKIFESITACENDPKKRKELLENLRTAMANFTRAQTAEHVDKFPLESLFGCLGEETEVTCGILKDLMAVSDPLKNLEKYHEYMLHGLQHPAPEVRVLVLAQLEKCAEAGGAALTTLCSSHQELLTAAVKEIVCEELGVGKEASAFLLKLAATDPGYDFLFGGGMGLNALKELMKGDGLSDALKFRVYEALAHVCVISRRHLEAVTNHLKLVETLSAATFESNDPLAQMNALEILAIVAETVDGIECLEKASVMSKVKQLGANWKNDPLSSLLLPGLLKFVGKVGVVQLPPKELLQMVVEAIVESGDDVALTTVGIEALAYIGSNPQGKQQLDAESRLSECFGKAHAILTNSTSEFRCRVLEALSHLFGSDESNTTLLPRWFALVFPQISVLFDLVQLPFADIRLSALNFLASIAHLEWAQKHYLCSPGVIEFLTDRNIEPDKDCALAKFKIVSIIVDSATPTTLKILSKENMARLRVHMRQGPFYAPAQSSVAFEGSS